MPHRKLRPFLTEFSTALESQLHKVIAQASLRFGMNAVVIVFCRGRVVWAQNSDGLMTGRCDLHTTLSTIAAVEDQVWIIPDTEQSCDASSPALLSANPPIRFVAGCPAWGIDGTRSAALCLFDTVPRQFDSVDLAILQELTNEVAHHVNTWARTALDPGTGIAQEAGFVPFANAVLAASTAKGFNASLIRITATAAPGSTRQQLHEADIFPFVDVLSAAFRGTDHLGRLGEREFAVLLIGSDYAEAIKALTRFRATLQSSNLGRPKAEHLGSTHAVVQYDRRRHRGIVDLLQENC